MCPRTARYEDLREKWLSDPEVRKAFDEMEPAYQIARLRIMRGLSQKQLAEKVGTKQPSIARLESGEMPPSLRFLERVVEALGGRMTITIEPAEGAHAASTCV